MPAHKWSSKIHSSSCSTCGVVRTAHRYLDSGAKSELPVSHWSYRLPDGHGSLDTRPPCTRPTESRRTRKMGRRRKVLSRSRAGGARLRSKEYERQEAIRRLKLSEFQKNAFISMADPDLTGGTEAQASMTTMVLG